MTWSDRKKLKQARELSRGACKLIRIRRDLLDSRALDELNSAIANLDVAIQKRDVAAGSSSVEKLDKILGKHFPQPKHAGLRENIEVFLVAAIVAMGVRTFFLQPFKIPTGSMQPTLYGIYPPRPPDSQYQPPIPYVEGAPRSLFESLRELPRQLIRTSEYEQIWPPSLLERLLGSALTGAIYEPGGYRLRGDHIFVDKLSYHFRKPHRGEVIVFATKNIPDLQSRQGAFYIKRLIGLSGDEVQIRPPYVLVNGTILDQRPAFKRIYSQQNGYSGYLLLSPYGFTVTPPKYINTSHPTYDVPPDHLFVLGDNSASSLDGRFWGSLPRQNLVGRAVLVYWPFTKRFGPID
ncbi:MAG TPA: signal peptidase I [Verrucomicrobiae bacterium]|nr:signal peptidase I [Verrucomicrobiae bacterium]